MTELDQWFTQAEPLMHLWRSLRFGCMCVRTSKGWTNFLGHAVLSYDDPPEDGQIKPILDTGDLAALKGHLELGTLRTLLSNLKREELVSGVRDYPTKLVLSVSQPGRWYGYRRDAIGEPSSRLELRFPTMIVQHTGPHLRDLLPSPMRNRIDEQLMLNTPPFDGIIGLARSMRLPLGQNVFSHFGDNAHFELCAPLPLRFQGIERNLQEKTLTVAVEAFPTALPNLASLFGVYSVDQTPLMPRLLSGWDQRIDGTPLVLRSTIALQHSKGELKLFLKYGRTHVETLTQYLSSLDPWIRACEYFDPDFVHFNQLKSATSRTRVSDLEMGALRLFGMLGLRAVWFGKRSAERKCDILAGHEWPDGRFALLVIECTEENPTAKITKVTREAESLRAFLGDENASILPTIYAGSSCSTKETRQAVDKGVALLGLDEVNHLLLSLQSGAQPGATIHYIKGLASAILGSL